MKKEEKTIHTGEKKKNKKKQSVFSKNSK